MERKGFFYEMLNIQMYQTVDEALKIKKLFRITIGLKSCKFNQIAVLPT